MTGSPTVPVSTFDLGLAGHRGRLLAELCCAIAARLGRPFGAIPGLQLFATEHPGPPSSTVAEASLAFVAQGAKRLVIGDQVIDYGPGDYLVVSLDLPVTGSFTVASPTEPFLGVSLVLDPSAVAQLVIDTDLNIERRPGQGAVEPPRRPGAALGAGAAPVEMIDALLRLIRLLDHPVDQRVLAPLIQREVLWRMLTGPQGDLVRAVGLQRSPLARIAQTVRWIRAHHTEPFRVEDLAADAAMSPSSFHRHFRAATAMGPLQYQKKIRLQQARLLVLGSDLDITGIAHAVGYSSPSQFSREYRREHGTSPSTEHAAR